MKLQWALKRLKYKLIKWLGGTTEYEALPVDKVMKFICSPGGVRKLSASYIYEPQNLIAYTEMNAAREVISKLMESMLHEDFVRFTTEDADAYGKKIMRADIYIAKPPT